MSMYPEMEKKMAKLSPEDRDSIAKQIGIEVEQALARAEAARAEANDPEVIRRKWLSETYSGTPERVNRGPMVQQRTHEAMDAWKKGERWESASFYPSMDFEAMDKAREAAAEAARVASTDPAAEWDKAQKAAEGK